MKFRRAVVLCCTPILFDDITLRLGGRRDCPDDPQIRHYRSLRDTNPFISRFQKLHDMDHSFLLRPQYSLDPTNVSKVLLSSPLHNQVTDVLTEIRVNGSLHRHRHFNVKIELLKSAIKNPS